MTPLRLISVDRAEFGANGRVVRYVLSTPAIGRDQHTVAADAWVLSNYLKNPVFLWAHDDTLPPIGRMVEIGTVGNQLKGTVEYADRDLNPFADTIYRLVVGGYLNAVSASWRPLEWSFARDKDRPGGIDFTKVDLLEVSQVGLPALPAALAEARRAGIDTNPLYAWAGRALDQGATLMPRTELEAIRRAAHMAVTPLRLRAAEDDPEWKVGASRDLPIEDSDDWDGPAAQKAIFAWAATDDESGEFDAAKARQGFLVYDAAKPDLKGSYKLPIATVAGGKLVVPKGAIRAAASRLPQTDIPAAVKKRAQAVLDHYKEKAGIGDDDDAEKRAQRGRRVFRRLAGAAGSSIASRGLYAVGQLAYLCEALAGQHAQSVWEAAAEEDDSKLPSLLADLVKSAGEALIAMTEEEVAEMIAAHGADGDDDGDADERAYVAAASGPATRAWRRALVAARAGRRLTHSNAKRLEEAQGHHERALKHHRAAVEHHEAVAGQLDEQRGAHAAIEEHVTAMGEALHSAQGNDGEATAHVGRALDHHRAAAATLDELGERDRAMADRHEDLGDSHRALGRSVRAAQRSVRTVIDGSVPEDEAGEEQKQRGLRRRLAAQLKSAPAV